ncbi:ras-associating and dilute domain-containing protein-like isoform X2 [Pristis pectinata]|uniref:ras-associating and dilute domain-containing protein-like isoform X2 n=1 Tax=Pristis pectinata TaxID=685728 RepID=UPI00223DAB09|nr:ras-associating and dilute domain-containing protein-like isoform X2 [Pristis pectinata]
MLPGERNASLSRHSLNIPVGLLISSPKRRLARLGRKHSNGSLQSNSSDTTVRSSESFGVRQPARSRIKRHNRSLATVFRGRSLKDEKAGDEEGGVIATDDPTELSTQVTAPGVLKIFGDKICAGANYKSVLATPCSSAQELVKEALERYSLEKSSAGDYVLCDVIGRLDEDHQWKTECFRVVSNCEKPLILQSLWKPKEGFVRRFEIRKKVDVEEIAAKEKDTVTAGINAQARRLQMTRTRASSALTDEEIESSFALWRSVSELNLSLKARETEQSTRSPRTELLDSEHNKGSCLGSEKEETESSDDSSTQYSIHPPFEFPYFLLLQGYSSRQDFVIHVLSGTSHLFGRYAEEPGGTEEEWLKVDIPLSAPDIHPRHCSVQRQELNPRREGSEVVTSVRPGKGAPVTHNGLPINRETQLHPGDLLGLGAHYLFMYKDPTLGSQSHSQRPAWFASPVFQLSPGGELQCRMCGCPVQGSGGGRSTLRVKNVRPRLQDPRGNEYEFTYELSQEDALLNLIIEAPDEESTDFKLTPGFLLSLCIQHSATSFHPADFRRLLLRIASQIQSVMWEKTKELAAIQREHAGEDCEETPAIGMRELIPGLQPLVYWMSNSIELLHFIQQEVPKLLAWEQQVDPDGCHSEQLLSTKLASEEAMTVLEEVIMFTFQQSVYYLTKTLYTVLPGLLDSNPFAANSSQLSVPQGVKDILLIFQETLSLLKQYQVHSEIASQLFAYLFFFTNASLFNALMERGSGGGFYQWSRGVQIRANLDLLLDWIQGVGLGELAAEFFLKLSTAVNLLATPKENLLQASWRCLRNDFVSLNPSQLHHMLREYSPGRPCPSTWSPVPEEQKAALRTADILESFDNHPPLILPCNTFHIELGKPMTECQDLSTHLQCVREFLQRLQVPEVPEDTSGTQTQQTLGAVPGGRVSPSADVGEEHTNQNVSHRCSPELQPVYRGKDIRMGRSLFLGRASGSLRSCQAELAHKLKNLELQSSLPGQQELTQKRLALDPSCLLTPPNTPQILELAECETEAHPLEAAAKMVNGDQTNACEGSRSKDGPTPQKNEADDEVFTVKLERGPRGLGLALVDGLSTPLNVSGIYIKSLVPDSPAAGCGKLRLGDRILAVNGTSLVGMDYQSGRELIRSAGDSLWLLVARSDAQVAVKVLMSSC